MGQKFSVKVLEGMFHVFGSNKKVSLTEGVTNQI